ncbi:MAG TPA: amino acid permease [Vicinamibacterales bacterium]|jgi:APA family basic amino acid/polyamine antiporter|nr:amino acid permease [Vicinamibacterales bacterium]
MSASPPAVIRAATLARRLGPIDAAAIVVSNVIGGGIFFVPVLVAQLVPDGRALLLVWAGGGALAFMGAMAYAELAALRPRAGGEYVYLREAYGPLAAFLTGWTSFVAGFSGAIAASAMALADYTGRFVPGAADDTPIITVPLPGIPLIVSRRTLVALVAIAALTCVHVRGLGPGRLVQNTLGGAKVAALIAFIAIGFAIGHGHAAPLAVPGGIRLPGLLMAFIPVMFTYSGWNAAVYVAEEVRSPERNVPLALGLGTLGVVAIYLGLNALYLHALPAVQLGGVQGARLIDTVAERLFGFVAGDLLAAFTIVSIAASVSAMIIAGPRVYFAMARDGLFPAAAARVHPRFRVPVAALVAQSIWSGVLVLSGTLAQLVSYTGFALVLFSGVAVSAVFVLRRRVPDAARPFRAWGYPWAPAIFVVASTLMIANEIWRSPGPSIAGLAIIASGMPMYWWMTKGGRASDR